MKSKCSGVQDLAHIQCVARALVEIIYKPGLKHFTRLRKVVCSEVDVNRIAICTNICYSVNCTTLSY